MPPGSLVAGALVPLAIAVAVPTAAGATAVLGVSQAGGVRPLGQAGDVLQVALDANATLRFEVRLTDDAGQPVDDCLTGGLEVRIIDQASGGVLGTRGCAEGDGVFRINSRQLVRPTRAIAAVPTGTRDSGGAVSATQSNVVQLLIRPSMVDLSPTTLLSSKTFPFRGRVLVARADRAGRIALERRVGRRWVRSSLRGLPASGRFEFAVRNGTWRARFVPRTGSGYVENSLSVTVLRRNA